MLCTDLTCHDISHSEAINTYANHIMDACIKAADMCNPCTRDRQSSGCIPGWSEHIKPLRDKSLFWHGLWLDCNRPKTGAVADCMRRTRAAYHYKLLGSLRRTRIPLYESASLKLYWVMVDETSGQKSNGFALISPVTVELWTDRRTLEPSLNCLLLSIASYTLVFRTIKMIRRVLSTM